MGKIRVKTFGDEEAEKKEEKKAKVKKEQKKAREESVESPEEPKSPPAAEQPKEEKKVEEVKKPKSPQSKKSRSKKYQAAKVLVDVNKYYPLAEALELLPTLKLSKFDETVELHINTIETGLSGNLTLPHGTGKKTRVVIADDKVIAEIEKGKLEFDILVATPAMMPKLAKVAKILGPRGLMPNPKAGTVTENPQEVVKKYENGQTRYKTEAKAPIIHLTVGKLSFGEKKLSENINMVISTIQSPRIKKVVLKSTMSPAIKLAF